MTDAEKQERDFIRDMIDAMQFLMYGDSNGNRQASPPPYSYSPQRAHPGTRPAPEPSPFPIHPGETPYAGIRAGEIIGWRCWFVTDDYRLRSIVAPAVWHPGKTIVADGALTDRLVDFAKPIYRGIYSWTESSDAIMQLKLLAEGYNFPYRRAADPPYVAIGFSPSALLKDGTVGIETLIGVVIGSIKIWGEVHEHEKGYRSEFARVDSLVHATRNVYIGRLRARYLP